MKQEATLYLPLAVYQPSPGSMSYDVVSNIEEEFFYRLEPSNVSLENFGVVVLVVLDVDGHQQRLYNSEGACCEEITNTSLRLQLGRTLFYVVHFLPNSVTLYQVQRHQANILEWC